MVVLRTVKLVVPPMGVKQGMFIMEAVTVRSRRLAHVIVLKIRTNVRRREVVVVAVAAQFIALAQQHVGRAKIATAVLGGARTRCVRRLFVQILTKPIANAGQRLVRVKRGRMRLETIQGWRQVVVIIRYRAAAVVIAAKAAIGSMKSHKEMNWTKVWMGLGALFPPAREGQKKDGRR
jgi:hypothetical protein